MTRHVPDDRRYMSYEQRAAEGDERFIVRLETPHTIETCYCGKTVIAVNGDPVRLDGKPVSCPRECKP